LPAPMRAIFLRVVMAGGLYHRSYRRERTARAARLGLESASP
jgi:hypothetical protein